MVRFDYDIKRVSDAISVTGFPLKIKEPEFLSILAKGKVTQAMFPVDLDTESDKVALSL